MKFKLFFVLLYHQHDDEATKLMEMEITAEDLKEAQSLGESFVGVDFKNGTYIAKFKEARPVENLVVQS